MPRRKRLKAPKTKPFSSERVAWNRLHGNGRRCAITRRRLREQYDLLFPKELENYHVQLFLECMGTFLGNGGEFTTDTYGEYLVSIDRDALRLVTRWGKSYAPYVWYGQPTMGEPQSCECFRNAYRLMTGHNKIRAKRKLQACRSSEMRYAEGIVMGAATIPMLHGWNVHRTDGEDIAIDWTFYATTRWSKYWGIEFSPEEYAELARVRHPKRKFPHSFFYRGQFNLRIKIKIMQVLARRKRAGKKVPKHR